MRIRTALILCAGFGKRVAPLTNTTPKPLLQIKNVTLLENSINFLKKCGIRKIKINTHYLSDEIENFIKKKNYKNEVELFFEKEILDTGGGIKNLANNDTDENFSSKVKKMNLIGAPYQIIIGKKTEGDLLEFKEIGKETKNIKLAEIIKIIKEQKAKN